MTHLNSIFDLYKLLALPIRPSVTTERFNIFSTTTSLLCKMLNNALFCQTLHLLK